MSKTLDTVINELNGHVWNTEGNKRDDVTSTCWTYDFSGQCVSLIKSYFKMLYSTPLSFGNAIDYYNNREINGIKKYCDVVYSGVKNGDIAVSNCVIDGVNFGHIMIYYNGMYLSQNVDMQDGLGARPKAQLYKNYWEGQIICWLRPKNYNIGAKVVEYCSHIQDIGWTDWVGDGTSCGTTGKSKRLEAFKIKRLDGKKIEQVKLHIQNKGWIVYDDPKEDEVFGTEGKSLRIENICIKASGLKFKVHIQDVGWTQWTDCDGISTLGSSGQSLRIEAIRIEKK